MGEKTILEVWKEFGYEARAKIIDICEQMISKNGSNHIDRTLLHDLKDLPDYQEVVIYHLIKETIVKRQNMALYLEKFVLNKEFWFYE